jgi:hypothetical protein
LCKCLLSLNKNNKTIKNNGWISYLTTSIESLVVPNWSLSYNNRIVGGEYKDNDDSDEEIDDDLHDKLVGLVKEHEIKETQKKKRKTRKQKVITNVKKGGTKRRK